MVGLLRHAVEQQLRDAGGLSYVQFQLLARLGDSSTGSHRMTDLADGVVYSRMLFQPLSSARSKSSPSCWALSVTTCARSLHAQPRPGDAARANRSSAGAAEPACRRRALGLLLSGGSSRSASASPGAGDTTRNARTALSPGNSLGGAGGIEPATPQLAQSP